MKKIFLYIFILLFASINAFANTTNSFIKKTNVEKEAAVTFYVKDIVSSSPLYNRNELKLQNPASTLKVLTFGASYFILGENYNFQTILYKDINSNIYIKLGGDVLFSSLDLNYLFNTLKNNTNSINNIYIDDTIIDKINYPDGWMKDDLWPNQKMLSPYIIDNNTLPVMVKRSSMATKVDISQENDYKFTIINELKLGDTQNISIKRKYGNNSPIINFEGTVAKDESINLPVLDSELNFKLKIKEALNKNKIKFSGLISTKQVPQKVTRIATVSHSIKDISKNILHNSDNFSSEIVFKVAAAKYINYSHPATLDDAIKMFYSVYQPVLTNDITIVDASGLSRYNLVSSKFMCDSMDYIFSKTNLLELLPTADEGTLKNRLIFLENNLRAKTGTLSKMSSIAGYLTTKSGKKVVFDIIIQNSPKTNALLKNLENSLITQIYQKY